MVVVILVLLWFLTMTLFGRPLCLLTSGSKLQSLWPSPRHVSLSTEKLPQFILTQMYAFGVCHAVGMLWLEGGFLTMTGKVITNVNFVKDLLSVLRLPDALGIVYYPGHISGTDPVSRGNNTADAAAKLTALEGPAHVFHLSLSGNADL